MRILETIDFKEQKHILVLCNNNSAIKLYENPVFHSRSKHIDVRFYFLRDPKDQAELLQHLESSS